MTDKVIKRGYVKWTDEDGVFHKEPLSDHPDMLKDASPQDQLAAEEVRRMNAAAEEMAEKPVEDNTKEVLEELKAAPDDVLTAAALTEDEPLSAPEEDAHRVALEDLREKTS